LTRGYRARDVGSRSLTAAVYTATLLPGVSFGDWSEMQSIPYQLGIAHPTGYPLAVILGKLWSFVPIGSVAYRANLLSAVEMSLALGVAVLIMGRLGVRPLVAAGLAIVLAAVPTVWTAATTARVDALHFLLVALMLHRALVWQQERRPRDLGLVALIAGLSLANHLLSVMVVPFVALFVVWVGRRELASRPILVLGAALAGCAGVALYLYIPIRAAFGPSWAYGDLLTPDGFWYLVSGEMFRDDMKFLGPTGLQTFVTSAGALLALVDSRWHPLLLATAVIGLGVAYRRNRSFAVLEVVLVAANLYFYVNYNGDLEHYLLLTWLVITTWIALAVDAAIGRATRFLERDVGAGFPPGRARRLPVAAVAGAMLIVYGAFVVGSNWRANDRSGDHRGEAFVDQVFAALPEDAVLLTYWDAIEPLWYAHCVEGRRPDLLILANPLPTSQGCQDFHGDVGALVATRPTYALLPFDGDYDALRARYNLVPVERLLVPYGDALPEFDRDLVLLQPKA
jgi:Protein O-mannosyl-transferase TMEM260-like